MQERALKLTRWAEDLQAKEHISSEELRAEAYLFLEKCGDYADTVDQRAQLLTQSIHFFRVAHTALTKLDQLEVQLTANQSAPGSQQLAQLHAQVPSNSISSSNLIISMDKYSVECEPTSRFKQENC